nr:phosphotransferase [Pseudarthrobacter sp. NBSH8]
MVDVSETVVQCLVRQQRPDLRDLPLARVANGWDNATFRLGHHLAVRLPRRAEAVPLILHEQRYLPGIARCSAVAVPVPVHAGRPTSDFPWPWSIVRWIPGAAAADVDPAERGPAAEGLVAFLLSLHVPAETGVPVNPFRGVPLQIVTRRWWNGSGTASATLRRQYSVPYGRRPAPLMPGMARR